MHGSEKVLWTIHVDTREKEGKTLVTSFTHLRGLLSIARESFVESSINWALSLPFFTSQRSIYPFSYRRAFFQSPIYPFLFPSLVPSINLDPSKIVSTVSSSRFDCRLLLFFANQVWKSLFISWNESVENVDCIKWLRFLRSVHSEVPIS